VKSEKKSKARLAFDITDPKGRYGVASAIVASKGLNGKATVPPSGSQPAVHLTFKTNRMK